MKDDDRVIPFHRPTIYPAHMEAVSRVLQSGWLTTGKVCEEFEAAFARYVGAKYAVSVNSCTAALHLALLGVQGTMPRKEVIMSPITFVSAASIIEQSGMTPVFCDVRAEDLNLDPACLERLITKDTGAIIATHMAGFACEMDEIETIAAAHGVPVITDAAHAIELQYRGRGSGQLGQVACYSFYGTKNITTGEGGMLVTDNELVATFARKMRLHGMDRDAWKRYIPGAYRHWDVDAPGFKYNMPDTAAALGLEQLKTIENWLGDRRMLWQFYESEFRRDERIALLPALNWDIYPALHLFIIRVKRRDEVMARLQERGVGVGVHFRGVHKLSRWRDSQAVAQAHIPVANQVSDEVLSIPIYPTLGIPDAERVVLRLRQVLDEVGCEPIR